MDCSAKWPNNVISQSNALQIAQKLAQWYGIEVTSTIPDSELQIVPQFTLNWGEVCQQVIERCCRYSALLYYEQPDGNLLLTRVSDKVAASGVEQGKNIESADFGFYGGTLFRLYRCITVCYPVCGDVSAVQNASARDPEAGKCGTGITSPLSKVP